MHHRKRKFNERRISASRATMGAKTSPSLATGSIPASAPPIGRRRDVSSGELFGRRPFTYGREPRYFGTGVPGYESGPGFTGGYYGYGDDAPEMPTELEREYAYDLYGEGADDGAKPVSKYPPGPKGYQRTDQRMREDICDQLMRTGHIDSSDVTVEVNGAEVQLDGSVPLRWMKHAIENLADACPGVQDILNKIRVRKPSSGV